ncbi:hypothetical protein [Sulfuricystis thermophila]|uniref:hypothetical protein n=1 Tax=Sulfuricystis thermophila TaxID=2496847 RepID=UPI0015592F76|nr:hypothetical protein [Sulfuricystis thermophila]
MAKTAVEKTARPAAASSRELRFCIIFLPFPEMVAKLRPMEAIGRIIGELGRIVWQSGSPANANPRWFGQAKTD